MKSAMSRRIGLAVATTLTLLLISGADLVAAAKPPPPNYTIFDIAHELNGGNEPVFFISFAVAINNRGQVLVDRHALQSSGGGAVVWPLSQQSTTGCQVPNAFLMEGMAINNQGDYVGWAGSFVGPIHTQAFLCPSQGSIAPLLPLPTGAAGSRAKGINDRTQVVGQIFELISDPMGRTTSVPRAVLWEPNGRVRDLGVLPGDSVSEALAINKRGEVVGNSGPHPASGSSGVSGPGTHAFVWDQAHGLQDLGMLPGASETTAAAINKQGHVVGTSGGHAFLWQKGKGMQDLGPGSATGINDHDQVVGTSGEHAFLWQKGMGMRDLPTLGGGSGASGINNQGWIAGASFPGGFGNPIRAVLWRPASPTDATIED